METSKQLRVLNKNCFVYFNLWKCTTIMRFACVYTTFSILISVVALTTKKYIETAHIYSNWHGTLLQNHNNELDTMRIVIVMVWNKKKYAKIWRHSRSRHRSCCCSVSLLVVFYSCASSQCCSNRFIFKCFHIKRQTITNCIFRTYAISHQDET